ncbi:MAG: tetratricopeptide repeat protein [Saprospiraceae bacterium]
MKKKILYLFLLLAFVPLFGQDDDVSSLQKQLSSASSDSSKIELSIQLLKLDTSFNLESSINYFHKSIDLAKKNKDSKALVKLYGTVGFCLVDKGQYASAATFLDQGLKLGHELNDPLLITRILIFQGNLNWVSSNLKRALEIFNEAKVYANKEKDSKSKAMILNTLGLIYADLNEREKQISYYYQAYEAFAELKDTFNQALVLNNIAGTLVQNQEYDKALPYLEKTVSLAESTQSRYPVFYELALGMKGEVLTKLGKEIEGFSFLELALDLASRNNHTRSQITINMLKSECHFDFGQYDDAIEAALTAVEISKATNYIKDLPGLSQSLAKNYKAKQDYKSSLFWLEEEIKAKKEIDERQKNKEIMQLEANHTIQQKEVENQILSLKNKHQKTFIALLFSAVLIFCFFVYYFFKKKQQKKLEMFRQRVAADLHDEVGSNLNNISRMAKGLKSNNHNQEINQGIDQLVKKSNHTIQNVVDVIWALDDEESKIEDLIEKMEAYLDNLKYAHKNIEINFIKNNISKNIHLPMNAKHHLLMVFKEAINNIQKHTFPLSIIIEIENKNKNLKINIVNTFQEKKENIHSTGRGLINIKRRIKDLGGVLNIVDKKN